MSKATWIPTILAVLACSICIAVAQQPTPPGKIPNVVEEPLQEQLRPQTPRSAEHTLSGRYQVAPLGDGGRFLLIDTHTGQCWARYVHLNNWQDLGSPIRAAK